MTALFAIIYAAFISLGLPDGILGASWPSIYPSIGAPAAGAGAIAMIVSLCTIISSFASGWVSTRLTTAQICIASTGLTIIGLAAMGSANSFALLALTAIPLGLGAGGIDAALNSFAALHMSAMHMNFLHAFWGVGALIGPLAAGFFISLGSWRASYFAIAAAQAVLLGLLVVTRGLWRRAEVGSGSEAASVTADPSVTATSPEVTATGPETGANAVTALEPWWRIKLVWPALIAFMSYCALESSFFVWSGTYFVRQFGLDVALAAAASSAFYIGMTIGRFAAGFATRALSNPALLRLGSALLVVGLVVTLASPSAGFAVFGLGVAGFGCAPIYPAIMKEAPRRFGERNVQRLTGIFMGFAYMGSLSMPPILGLIITAVSPLALPVVVLASAAVMFGLHEYIERSL